MTASSESLRSTSIHSESLVPVVAIDGPCGVGKSTVAREVADRLGFQHIDTGAMYRAVTWYALSQNVNLRDADALSRVAAECTLQFEGFAASGQVRIRCNGEEITEAIRDREVSVAVSDIADCEAVRDALVAQQRTLGLLRPSVLEGRDITTVVFPDAKWKFFLEADVAIRGQRRIEQLKMAGKPADREVVLSDLIARDQRDRIRPKGALRLAKDAVVVDTGHMPRSQVVDLIVTLVMADR